MNCGGRDQGCVKLPGHAENRKRKKQESHSYGSRGEGRRREFRSADITTDGFLVPINISQVERNRGREKGVGGEREREEEELGPIYRMLLAANQEDDGDDVQ
jgi:hypothetical protein